MKTDELVSRLGKHLQSIRKERKLTLEKLSTMSGVSRSMLSQIERGQANPTFGTLWNLGRALGLEVSELVEEIETQFSTNAPIEHLTAADTPTITNQAHRYTLTILGPPRIVEQVEWYQLTVQSGGDLTSQPHTQGCREHLTLISGSARIVAGDQTLDLNAGETARYHADIPHSITCTGESPMQAFLVVMF